MDDVVPMRDDRRASRQRQYAITQAGQWVGIDRRLVATPQMVTGLPVGSRILLTLTPY